LEAAEWANSLPEGNSKYKAVEEIVKQWSKEDPAQAATWINQFPSNPGLDPAISSLVKQIAAKDPENALRWAETVSDDATRKELISFAEKKVKEQKFPLSQ
jgi:hypothetical protein